MAEPKVEWSLHRDPDLIMEIWSTAALTEAVLEALLEDPDARAKALRTLQESAEKRT